MKKEDIMQGGRFFPYFWICVLSGIGICLLLCFFVFRPEAGDAKGPDDIGNAESIEVTQSAEVGTEAGKEVVTLGLKEEIQREVLGLFFNPDVRYGMEYRNGVLTSEGFSKVFYESRGKKIGMNDVSVGDYAIGNGISGICIGYYEGFPVYAYMSEYAACGAVVNGVCMGYSMEQRDELFFGMYPVFFETYYKGSDETVREDVFPEHVELIPEEPWYTNLVYAYGRLMANVATDTLMMDVYHDRLGGDNQKLNRDSFEKFLKNLPGSKGFEGDYYLYVESVKEESRYTEVEVSFIPRGTYWEKPIGSWKLTFYPEQEKFLPCGVNYKQYPEVGFVRENKVTVKEEDGKVKVEKEEIIYGQTVDEEGRRIYRLEDGTVIYLD